ncbi:uncharacterized protein LOC135303514 [Passer domesticus]|uniref:uncharacterized protein LOC135303514 n=1 Tax=Passer domesticus TaxID=48849 RepID=UPI0030FF1E91
MKSPGDGPASSRSPRCNPGAAGTFLLGFNSTPARLLSPASAESPVPYQPGKINHRNDAAHSDLVRRRWENISGERHGHEHSRLEKFLCVGLQSYTPHSLKGQTSRRKNAPYQNRALSSPSANRHSTLHQAVFLRDSERILKDSEKIQTELCCFLTAASCRSVYYCRNIPLGKGCISSGHRVNPTMKTHLGRRKDIKCCAGCLSEGRFMLRSSAKTPEEEHLSILTEVFQDSFLGLYRKCIAMEINLNCTVERGEKSGDGPTNVIDKEKKRLKALLE